MMRITALISILLVAGFGAFSTAGAAPFVDVSTSSFEAHLGGAAWASDAQASTTDVPLEAALEADGAVVRGDSLDDADSHAAGARIREAASALLDERFPNFSERLDVRVLRINTSAGGTAPVKIELPIVDGVPKGHTQVRVFQSGPDGSAESGWAVIYVAHYDSVLVAQRNLRSGEPVRKGDIATAWIDITSFRGHPMPADVIETLRAGETLFATIPIGSGDVVRAGDLRPPHAAATGQSITMTYRRGTVVLKLPCRAREPGAAGELIRLYSDTTRSTYKARLGPDGTAEWVATL